MITGILFISFFILLFLDIPIAICLGASSALAILASGQSLLVIATNTYSGISKFLLLAIPFFILSGNIMAKAGISTRLVKFVDSLIGHKKGGIAIVCVIVACFFGAISGSGPATVAALGAVLIPAMIDAGFSAPFASALMATASSVAIVIPPSIAYIVYASITGASVGDMFMAGIIPGILVGAALILVVMYEVKKHNIPASREEATSEERAAAFKDAFWAFLMPVIILGGIYGGIFTPTEAAAVAVVYGLFVGMFIYKEIKVSDLYDLIVDSAKTTGSIMLIIGSASLFSYVCTVFGISDAAENLLLGMSANQVVFLLICNVIFLIAGCFIDANSAMYIFVPIMLPVCQALDYSVVAFGILATVNLAIGQVTPPVGVNLFVAVGLKIRESIKVTMPEISRTVMPMVISCLVVLGVVTYIPQVSLLAIGGKDSTQNGPKIVRGTISAENTIEAYDNETYDPKKDAVKYNGPEFAQQTWHFACSTGNASTWAKAGRYFGALMAETSGGKVVVKVDGAADALTNGNQKGGISALIDGSVVQISMHSNLIYSAFDQRFNVISLPYIYKDYADVDRKFDGAGGDQMKKILKDMGLHCFGIAENGFRQLTTSKKPVKSVADMKHQKIRVAGSNLLMKSYEKWGADATNMNWGETYTALQQGTVEGQENPLPAIASASVQDVQGNISLWNAYYDCLFFAMNQGVFDKLTPEQQKVVEENAMKAVKYQRAINRYECDLLIKNWKEKKVINVIETKDIDTAGFKAATADVAEWYVGRLVELGNSEKDARELVNAFTQE